MPGAVLGIEAPAGNSNFKWGALVGAAGNEQPVSGINTPVTEYGRQSSGTAGGGGPSPWLSARPPLNSAPSSSQEKNQRPTHLTGAFLAFFVGILYFWLQLFLSWRMKNLPQPGAPWIGPLRLVLCSACFVLEVASILPWSGGGSPMGWVCRAVLGAPSFLSLGLRSPVWLSLHPLGRRGSLGSLGNRCRGTSGYHGGWHLYPLGALPSSL